MKKLADYVGWLSEVLQGRNVTVSFYDDHRVQSVASYGNDNVSFNLAKSGWKNIGRPFTEHVTGVILHELAHRRGEGHDNAFITELERLAAKLAHELMRPSHRRIFEQYTNVL